MIEWGGDVIHDADKVHDDGPRDGETIIQVGADDVDAGREALITQYREEGDACIQAS